MQEMDITSGGFPFLYYPISTSVTLTDPAGEHGVPPGSFALPSFGDSLGDPAANMPTYGHETGTWSTSGRQIASSSTGGQWDQIFSIWDPNPANFTAHVSVQWVKSGTTWPYPKFGLYCAYERNDYHAEVFLDLANNVMATHGVSGGVDQGWQNTNLPSGFNKTAYHTLDCTKSGNSFTFYTDKGLSGQVSQTRTIPVTNGQIGLVVVDTQANYKDLSEAITY
jgi:hypothetical protein